MYLRQTILNRIYQTLQSATGSYSSNIGSAIKIADGEPFNPDVTLDAYIFPSNTSYDMGYAFANPYTPTATETDYDIVIYANSGSGSLNTVLTAMDDIYTCIGNNFQTIVNTFPTLELKMKNDEIQIQNDTYTYVVGHIVINTKYTIPNFHPTGSMG